MMGDSFTNRAKVTPRHNSFVQRILQSGCHIFATIRSKQDYVLSEKNGKMVPEKIGLKGVTREGLDYEFTIVLELDLKHQATATKDSTQLFMDKPSLVITPETGKQIRQWCESGPETVLMYAISVDELREMIFYSCSVEGLTILYKTYPQSSQLLLPEYTKRKQEILNNNLLSANMGGNSNGTANG